MPQTIYFMDEWGIGEARRCFNAHRNLTLLCRDRASLAFARRHFTARSLPCPDMAFALGPLRRSRPPEGPIVWLSRTDAESAGASLPAERADVRRLDWLDEVRTPLQDTQDALGRRLLLGPPDWPAVLTALMATYDALAEARLRRGCDLLSRGKVVITDRLHGHILCLLLGIPHVLLDNNYGKVRGFHDTWTADSPLTHWAASPAEALRLAEALAATTP
jgi:pyruvyl transferase EpsO